MNSAVDADLPQAQTIELQQVVGDDSQHVKSTTSEVFTVDEAIEACGYGWFQFKVCMFSGFIWVVDAMEIMVLSILAPLARCDYGLKPWEESLLTSVVFVGMILGFLVWGMVMDRHGRKKVLFVICVLVAVSALISAFAPNYAFLVVFRSIVGFGTAGAFQGVTYFVEFLPVKRRGYVLMLSSFFWTFGTMVEVLLALLLVGHYQLDWHWLLGFTAVPLFIDLLAFPFVPESPYYCISAGDVEKARKILERMAQSNGKVLPVGRLVSVSEKQRITNEGTAMQQHAGGSAETEMSSLVALETVHMDRYDKAELAPEELAESLDSRGQFKDLFSSRETATVTCLLWIVWIGAVVTYYGIVIFTTEILNIIKEQAANGSSDTLPCVDAAPAPSEQNCTKLDTSDYVHLLWTASAEFPAVALTVVVIEKFGRRKTAAVEFLLAAGFFFLMFICPLREEVLMVFVFGARGTLTGASQVIFIYTPEAYPTAIRSLGLGAAGFMGHIGSIVTPFMAEVLVRTSIHGTEGTYAAFCLVCAVCTILLPIETRGRPLQESLKN